MEQKQENALKRALLNERNMDADNPLQTMRDEEFLNRFRFTKDTVQYIIKVKPCNDESLQSGVFLVDGSYFKTL